MAVKAHLLLMYETAQPKSAGKGSRKARIGHLGDIKVAADKQNGSFSIYIDYLDFFGLFWAESPSALGL